MKKIKCKCCNETIELSDGYYIGDVTEQGWGIIWDVSNGLTAIKICPECNKKIQEHVKAIEDILNMPFWKINIPSDRED